MDRLFAATSADRVVWLNNRVVALPHPLDGGLLDVVRYPSSEPLLTAWGAGEGATG